MDIVAILGGGVLVLGYLYVKTLGERNHWKARAEVAEREALSLERQLYKENTADAAE